MAERQVAEFENVQVADVKSTPEKDETDVLERRAEPEPKRKVSALADKLLLLGPGVVRWLSEGATLTQPMPCGSGTAEKDDSQQRETYWQLRLHLTTAAVAPPQIATWRIVNDCTAALQDIIDSKPSTISRVGMQNEYLALFLALLSTLATLAATYLDSVSLNPVTNTSPGELLLNLDSEERHATAVSLLSVIQAVFFQVSTLSTVPAGADVDQGLSTSAGNRQFERPEGAVESLQRSAGKLALAVGRHSQAEEETAVESSERAAEAILDQEMNPAESSFDRSMAEEKRGHVGEEGVEEGGGGEGEKGEAITEEDFVKHMLSVPRNRFEVELQLAVNKMLSSREFVTFLVKLLVHFLKKSSGAESVKFQQIKSKQGVKEPGFGGADADQSQLFVAPPVVGHGPFRENKTVQPDLTSFHFAERKSSPSSHSGEYNVLTHSQSTEWERSTSSHSTERKLFEQASAPVPQNGDRAVCFSILETILALDPEITNPSFTQLLVDSFSSSCETVFHAFDLNPNRFLPTLQQHTNAEDEEKDKSSLYNVLSFFGEGTTGLGSLRLSLGGSLSVIIWRHVLTKSSWTTRTRLTKFVLSSAQTLNLESLMPTFSPQNNTQGAAAAAQSQSDRWHAVRAAFEEARAARDSVEAWWADEGRTSNEVPNLSNKEGTGLVNLVILELTAGTLLERDENLPGLGVCRVPQPQTLANLLRCIVRGRGTAMGEMLELLYRTSQFSSTLSNMTGAKTPSSQIFLGELSAAAEAVLWELYVACPVSVATTLGCRLEAMWAPRSASSAFLGRRPIPVQRSALAHPLSTALLKCCGAGKEDVQAAFEFARTAARQHPVLTVPHLPAMAASLREVLPGVKQEKAEPRTQALDALSKGLSIMESLRTHLLACCNSKPKGNSQLITEIQAEAQMGTQTETLKETVTETATQMEVDAHGGTEDGPLTELAEDSQNLPAGVPAKHASWQYVDVSSGSGLASELQADSLRGLESILAVYFDLLRDPKVFDMALLVKVVTQLADFLWHCAASGETSRKLVAQESSPLLETSARLFRQVKRLVSLVSRLKKQEKMNRGEVDLALAHSGQAQLPSKDEIWGKYPLPVPEEEVLKVKENLLRLSRFAGVKTVGGGLTSQGMEASDWTWGGSPLPVTWRKLPRPYDEAEEDGKSEEDENAEGSVKETDKSGLENLMAVLRDVEMASVKMPALLPLLAAPLAGLSTALYLPVKELAWGLLEKVLVHCPEEDTVAMVGGLLDRQLASQDGPQRATALRQAARLYLYLPGRRESILAQMLELERLSGKELRRLVSSLVAVMPT